jgi:RhtB (resistance to homoserine/threonine) family protein
MTLTIWLSLVVVCVLGTISPGPSLAVVLRQTLSSGRRHGMLTSLSHSLGVALWALLTLWGLGVLVTKHPVLYDLITYAGAAYLAWLGFKALRSKGSGQFEQKNAQSSYFTALVDGAMISLLNPKLAIFFIALFSQFISAEQLISDKMIMVTTVTLIDLVWFMSVAVVLSQPRVIKTLREKSKTMDKISGVVMIGLALRVIV